MKSYQQCEFCSFIAPWLAVSLVWQSTGDAHGGSQSHWVLSLPTAPCE